MNKGLAAALLVWVAGPVWAADLTERIARLAVQFEPQVVAWRRDVHRHPELPNREFRTAALAAGHLEALGFEVRTGVAHTGVVGVLRGARPGPTVALRADMDALPVVERTGLPFASTVRTVHEGREVGVMHACGHDNHVAILLGAASVLAELAAELPGRVVFLFQPAEEGAPHGERGGAQQILEEGVLEAHGVAAIFALHVSQAWAVGQAAYRPYRMMASAQEFEITVSADAAGAASHPNPVVVGARVVEALQSLEAASATVTAAPARVTVSRFESGIRGNVVAESARLSGTIRTFDPYLRDELHARLERLAVATAEAMGAKAEVAISDGVPVVYNDGDLAHRMRPTLQRVYGTPNVLDSGLVTAAEDFAFYQQTVPGLLFFIGVRPRGRPAAAAVLNHSGRFDADEAALVLGVRAMAGLAVDYLRAAAEAD